MHVVLKPVRGMQDPLGEAVYAAKCAVCHGADGEGKEGTNGAYLFPALWGPRSFNIGAGMARLSNADAVDVAAYFTRKPRPDFPAKSRDWPKGDKPSDVPY